VSETVLAEWVAQLGQNEKIYDRETDQRKGRVFVKLSDTRVDFEYVLDVTFYAEGDTTPTIVEQYRVERVLNGSELTRL
jgi:hypothetical protein